MVLAFSKRTFYSDSKVWEESSPYSNQMFNIPTELTRIVRASEADCTSNAGSVEHQKWKVIVSNHLFFQ